MGSVLPRFSSAAAYVGLLREVSWVVLVNGVSAGAIAVLALVGGFLQGQGRLIAAGACRVAPALFAAMVLVPAFVLRGLAIDFVVVVWGASSLLAAIAGWLMLRPALREGAVPEGPDVGSTGGPLRPRVAPGNCLSV